MHLFDRDISLETMADLHFRSTISDNWSVNGTPDGGYLMSILANALAKVSDKDFTPIFTANYISRCIPGDADIYVEEIERSTGFTRLEARMFQHGREKVRMLGTFARNLDDCEVERYEGSPPDLAPLEDCIPFSMLPDYTLFANIDLRLDPRCAGWLYGKASETSKQKGWIRFSDDRPLDMLSIPLMADSFPPPVFASEGSVAWVPTIEFTLNVRNLPESRWLKCVFRTRFITCGLVDDDGELWDEKGNLVAICRQIAQYRKTGS